MPFFFPNYENCSVNLIASISQYCGLAPRHKTHPYLDALFQKKAYQNIILMLFDGMGMDMLEKTLPEDAFLRKALCHPLSSVYPSTTTCATTAIETGMMPCEHAWLGWTLYFHQIDKLVDVYTNRTDTNEIAADYYVGERFIPRQFIYPKITACGKYKACSVSFYGDVKIKTLPELFENVLSLAKDHEKRYIYTYWPEPDSTMHKKGCYHEKSAATLLDINDRVEKLASQLPDNTLLLLTADHGLIDTKTVYLEDYPALHQMLQRDSTIELRALSFHVKKEYLDVFPDVFQSHFPGQFLVIDRETFIRDYLGPGNVHPQVYDFVGDYMALSTGDISMMNHPGSMTLIGNHAGLTKEEMIVPLIIAKK